MSSNTALAISVGVLGAIAAWLFLGPLGGALAIWAAYIAWGCFFQCGGREHGLQTTIVCNIVGAIIGGIALLAASASVGASLPPNVWTAICLGIGLAVMVLLANVSLLATIPAQIYGFASVLALGLMGNAGASVTQASLANPVVIVILSMAIGAVFGYVSERVAGMLAGIGHHHAAAKA